MCIYFDSVGIATMLRNVFSCLYAYELNSVNAVLSIQINSNQFKSNQKICTDVASKSLQTCYVLVYFEQFTGHGTTHQALLESFSFY